MKAMKSRKPDGKANGKVKVSLFGEILVDVYSDRRIHGGAPYNVARHLKGLGLEPFLVSRVGIDAEGEAIISEMHRGALSTDAIQRDPIHPTGSAIIESGSDGHRFHILDQQAYDYIHPGMTHLACLGTSPAIAYFGTLAQRNTKSRSALDIYLHELDCPHFLDLNIREPWINRNLVDRSLKRAQIVKLSSKELEQSSELLGLGNISPEAAAIALIKDYGLDSMIVTDGAFGAWMMLANHRIHHVDGLPIENLVVDTVGAGDAFSAMCISGLIHGWTPQDMLMRANEFAANVCMIHGAVPDHPDFYLPFLQESMTWE